MRTLLTISVSMVLACTARAQGYFTFPEIPGVSEQPAVQIDLNPQMLGFVRAAVGAGGEAEAAELLAGIEGVRVRVYEHLEDPEAVLNFVDDTSGELERDGWQRAVFVQDDGDRVRVYMRFEEERMSGMTVMMVDEDDAVFINVAGEIDPVLLGQLTREMGITDVADSVDGVLLPALTRPGRGASAGSEDGSSAAGSPDDD